MITYQINEKQSQLFASLLRLFPAFNFCLFRSQLFGLLRAVTQLEKNGDQHQDVRLNVFLRQPVFGLHRTLSFSDDTGVKHGRGSEWLRRHRSELQVLFEETLRFGGTRGPLFRIFSAEDFSERRRDGAIDEKAENHGQARRFVRDAR